MTLRRVLRSSTRSAETTALIAGPIGIGPSAKARNANFAEERRE